MNISGNRFQISEGSAYLNFEETTSAEITVYSVAGGNHVRHILAWGQHGAYRLLLINGENFDYWWQNERPKYGKVLEILSGGVQNILWDSTK